MTIEGLVKAVMETFPLQLKVEAGGEVHHVSLTDRTSVSRRGRPVDPGRIAPSVRVRVSGPSDSAGSAGITADTVEILDT